MTRNTSERRLNSVGADEVMKIQQELWAFAERSTDSLPPEATLRPGAYLKRVYQAWHSLGKGTGLASHSFRALRAELLKKVPPVRNLQPKLNGSAGLSVIDASHLVDVMLETWSVSRGKNGRWQMRSLSEPQPPEEDRLRERLISLRENLIHTLFKGEEVIFMEDPVGEPPEIFMAERGRSSMALIIPTKVETTAHLSPSNAYGAFSSLNGIFFEAVMNRDGGNDPPPLLIWVLRLGTVRDNAEFHQSFHSIALYSACLTNWYFRLSRARGDDRTQAERLWRTIVNSSAFVIHGLPLWARLARSVAGDDAECIDEDLADLEPRFFVPDVLPIALSTHRQVRRLRGQGLGLNVSVEPEPDSLRPLGGRLEYWLFPAKSPDDLDENAETTGLPVSRAEISPGKDYDIVYTSIYEAVSFYLNMTDDEFCRRSFHTLISMGWQFFTIEELQRSLLVSKCLGST